MRNFFGRKNGDKIVIENEEFNHLKNVLRLGVGVEILVSLNDEFSRHCVIEKMNKNFAECREIDKKKCEANPQKNIVLFQAIAKREKFDFILQKATEIGITRIVPFASEYCVVKKVDEKKNRYDAVFMNACKQCERTIMPILDSTKSVKEVAQEFKHFDVVLFANERTNSQEKIKDLEKFQNIAIIVGAEGGFTQAEKDVFEKAGAISISLGKRIFRCETAAVAMMSLVSIMSGN